MSNLSEYISEVNKESKCHGEEAVYNLCRLSRKLGFKDDYGQFAHDGAYGDLISMLENCPELVMKIYEYILEHEKEFTFSP